MADLIPMAFLVCMMITPDHQILPGVLNHIASPSESICRRCMQLKVLLVHFGTISMVLLFGLHVFERNVLHKIPGPNSLKKQISSSPSFILLMKLPIILAQIHRSILPEGFPLSSTWGSILYIRKKKLLIDRPSLYKT